MTETSAAFIQANRRRPARSAIAVAVLAIMALTISGAGTASAAMDPVAKCQSSIGKAGRKLVKSHLAAWHSCLAAELAGKTCNTAVRDAKLSAAGAKFIAGVRARCEGLALFTAAPAGLGFAQTCNLEPAAVDLAGCRDLPATDAASLGTCLLCWKRAELDGLVRAANPCLASQTPAAGGLTCGTPPPACPTDGDGRRCTSTIAATTLARAQARIAAMENCLDRKRAGKVIGACPDAIAQKRLSAAETKAAAAMRACQTTPPWWDQCPRDTSAPCGPALTTLEAVTTCAASIAGAVADEMVCQQYPSAGADGLSCPVAEPTTTTTTTTTTTVPASVCGNDTVEGDEQCDPPTSACGAGGVCDTACACIGSAPIITGISPPGAGLGDIVTIAGSYFGNDAAAVTVRFTYEESGETLQSTVPVLEAAGTLVRVAVPLVAPLKTNLVEVLVGAATSNAFPYETGGYPWDPTPDEPGSEITSLLGLIDELARRFDLKLDPWFVGTGALSPTDATELHDAAAAMRQGIANFLASLAATDPDVLRAVDGLLSAPLFLELRAKVQAAIDALHGSPTGEILCEAQKVVEILGDVLALLNVISTIIDIIVTTVTAACAVSVILAILTVGLAGPLAAIVCGGGLAAVIEILRTINEILAACAVAITAITYAAPTTPIPDTWTLQVQHDAWYGAEPDFVYVDGTPAVEARSWQDFHNEACAPSGCDISFTVDVFEVPVPVSITVPHIIVAHQAMNTDLAFPPGVGGPGFYAVPSGIDGLSLFTGADVNGPQRVRGGYDVTFSSDCTDRTGLLGSDTHSYDLIGGPHIVSIDALSGQLGEQVEICAEDMPPNPSYVAVDFGDIRADVTPSGPGCYLFGVPDSVGTTPITLLGQGKTSDNSQPFTIDPPELDYIEPAAAFPGETVTVFGGGFAANPDNNVLTLDGVPLLIQNSTQGEIDFQVPDAASGMLQLVAVGVHQSNQIPLTVLHWSTPATLSLGTRDATRPAVAVNDAGAVGVVWADRSASGGLWRLLYTDVSPGHSAFRAPFEISTDLGQFGDAPEKPAITALSDGDFLVAWITGDGSIRRMSIVPSGSTTVESVVATAPIDMAWHDVEVAAVRASGVVMVAAEGQTFDASYLTELFSFTSTDNGATFGPATSFAGPAAYAGEIDLAWSNDRLVRAWRLLSNFFGPTLFTELSADGLSFSLAEDASSDGGEGNEVPARPSAAALSSGAIAAWEKPHNYGEDLRVHGEPYPGNAGSTFSSGGGHDGHPALIADADDIATVAWVSRITGNSPDLVTGVPRVLVSRSSDAFESTTSTGLTPTVAAGDIDTVDSEPALGVGPDQRAHLVWLAGTPGARILRYTTTVDPGYADAPPGDDPAATAGTPHEWIAAGLPQSDESFVGDLAIDLTDPRRTRWLANAGGRPSLHPQIAGLLDMKPVFPTLWDLGDGEAALDSPEGGFLEGPVENAAWTPDQRIFGIRIQLYLAPEGWVEDSYYKLALSSAPWPTLGGFGYVRGAMLGVRFGEMQAAFSASGNYVALTHVVEVTDYHFEYSLEVIDLSAGSSTIFSFPDGSEPSWSPVEDKLVFVERIDADPADETYFEGVIMHEWSVGDPAPTPLLTPPLTTDLALPRYSPDGTDVVYQRREALTDPWFVELLSGSSAPAEIGAADTSPVWSPDGAALLFVRSVMPDFVTTYASSSELATWVIGAPTAQRITDLPDFARLGGAEFADCSATGKVNECFDSAPSWVEMQP